MEGDERQVHVIKEVGDPLTWMPGGVPGIKCGYRGQIEKRATKSNSFEDINPMSVLTRKII